MSRDIALKIACLDSADRDWIIEQMSFDERYYFEPLVQEAIELGLTRDISVLSLSGNSAVISNNRKELLVKELGKNYIKLQQVSTYWQKLIISSLNTEMQIVAIEELELPFSLVDCEHSLPPALYKSVHKSVLGA